MATDPDSQMLSSPSDSDIDTATATQLTQQPPSVLSPPDSQHRGTRSSNMPTAASGSAVANANGKRPLNTISNGLDDGEDGTRPIDQPRREFPTQTHAASGYKWDRAEDEPGYAWLNTKAKKEMESAVAAMVHKDFVVQGRYGDIFELVENERAVKESLQQKS